MILTLEKLEKDLEVLSKLLKEDPSKLWEKAILGEAKGDDGQVVKFEVALASLPMNEYGQKIYSNAVTYGGKDKDVDMQMVDSYLPKVYQKLRSNTPYEFFERLANFMNNPSGTVGDMMIPAREANTKEPVKMNIAQQLGFSFSALLAYKILLETFVNIEASPAGKILEFITAGLTGGYVESDTEIADFVGGDGVDYSLKFLKPGSKYEGSLISLYRAIHAVDPDERDKGYKRVIYLTIVKKLDGKVVNFDQVSLDDLRKSKIDISFAFFEIDPEKIEQIIFTDKGRLQAILKAIQDQSPEDKKSPHYKDFMDIMKAKNIPDFIKAIESAKISTRIKKKVDVQDWVHSLELIKNINDLGEIVKELSDLPVNSEKIDIPIPNQIKTYFNQLQAAVKVVKNPKPDDDSNYSTTDIEKTKKDRLEDTLRDQSEEIKKTKAFQEIEANLKNTKDIIRQIGKELSVSRSILAFWMPRGADLSDPKEAYFDALETSQKRDKNFPYGMGASTMLLNPTDKEVRERIEAMQKLGVMGDVSSKEINLIHRLFHILRSFKMKSSPLEINPRYHKEVTQLSDKQGDFEAHIRGKILSDPKIKGIVKKQVQVKTGDKVSVEDDDGPFSNKIVANLKVERNTFFKNYCKQTPDMPIIRMEFSAEKFVNTFENFKKDHDGYNKIIINAVRKICTNLTDFNKNFRESLTEGLTYDSLDPALESLAGLTQSWNMMSKTRAKQEIIKEKEKG